MDHMNHHLHSTKYRDKLIFVEIVDQVNRLVEIYKTTENIADQQYIFSKFHQILKDSDEKKMMEIRQVVLDALTEITRV